MYFGLNVSYLGLFVLKKFGNLHQIYFYCSPENLLQGYIRADIFMVGICFPNRLVGSLTRIAKLQEMGTLLAPVVNAAYPSGECCLPRLGIIRAQNVPTMFHVMNVSKGDAKSTIRADSFRL